MRAYRLQLQIERNVQKTRKKIKLQIVSNLFWAWLRVLEENDWNLKHTHKQEKKTAFILACTADFTRSVFFFYEALYPPPSPFFSRVQFLGLCSVLLLSLKRVRKKTIQVYVDVSVISQIPGAELKRADFLWHNSNPQNSILSSLCGLLVNVCSESNNAEKIVFKWTFLSTLPAKQITNTQTQKPHIIRKYYATDTKNMLWE